MANIATKKERQSGKSSTNGNGKRSVRKVTWPTVPSVTEWPMWSRHLVVRNKPASLKKLASKPSGFPLTWLPLDHTASDCERTLYRELVRVAGGKHPDPDLEIEHLSEQWLATAAASEPTHAMAMVILAWAHALPKLAATLTSSTWCSVAMHLVQTTHAASALLLDENALTHQLLAGELGLTLGYLFPELAAFRDLRKPACRQLSRGVIELTDGEGLIHGRHLSSWRSLLASWTRCALLSRAAGWSCFDAAARNQYEWAVLQTLRLTRSDGTQVLSHDLEQARAPGLLSAMLEEGGTETERELASHVFAGRLPPSSTSKHVSLPDASVYSEWAETCVMRNEWRRKSPQLVTVFTEGVVRTELSTKGQLVWSGDCTPKLHLDGREQTIQSDWRELCWFTDTDVDYLELEVQFDDDWRIQRQILLSRSDQFLFMADVVLGSVSRLISLQTSFPLGEQVRWEHDPMTRDGILRRRKKTLAVALPLPLAEWTSEATNGQLVEESRHLQMTHSQVGKAMYSACFFDLASKRLQRPRTWRRLTIAENRVLQGPDIAVGHRIQAGGQQWLIYRSLAKPANRSVLGQNLSQEFVVARFDKDGLIHKLIEIE